MPKVKEKNDYTKNEWLKLLGKSNTSLARTCELVKKEFSNKYVLNAIKLLHHLIQDKDYTLTLLLEYRQIEEQYVSDQEQAEEKAKLKQLQAQLAKTEAEIDKMNTYIRKVTLIKDITKFSKTDQKESFKFAKILKHLSKEDLEKLLNDKAKKSQRVQNYLNAITQREAEFNDNSTDEENSFEDL